MTAPVCGLPKPNGQPCGWVLNGRECPHHGDNATPERRHARALKGGIASRMRTTPTLPAGAPDPRFATREEIVRWCEAMAGKTGRGELDPKLSAELRQWGALALAVRNQEAIEVLARSLSVLEHGPGAVLLLERLRDGLADGRRRPLPGRVVPLPAPDGEAS